MHKKYYSVLGLTDAACANTVKHQFRRLAMQHHPDRTGGRPSDEYLRLCEAYEQLKPHLKPAPETALTIRSPAPERRRGRRGSPSQRRFSIILETDFLGTRLDDFA
ncbi:DnaJ domain-containing protein [Simiduia agarivorans]|uniref:Chaperone protein DnaJ n=1 Tax=Simiduia agarivorans (strain DSM 21679 / JCM 13881 / BCRC 17597 / SA1) TaxID=1117647 RepID=K4KMM8_SIMAS|nr:DnaJ domain-containing protein [Simiduia agarivorans]AFV00267.1 chaperone protein DnaJ [Simiduia agarivorans SA1 = DSM 21679]